MTKKELLEEIAEIPEDKEIMAYHVTYDAGDGMGTKGSITCSGMNALLHAAEAMNHAAQCLDIDRETAAKVAMKFFEIHEDMGRIKSDGGGITINEAQIRAMFGGKDDADQ